MKILITGSGGFVGRNLVAGLKEKYELFYPRSQELNLTDYRAVEQYLKKNKITHVIHAAVHSGLSISREAGFQGDLRMLTSLTRCLDKLDKLIVFGSGAEFAKTREMKKVREDEWGEYVPEDLYGLSKFITTEIVRREPKMLNLRLFGIYGPQEDYRYKFISNTIVKKLLGMPIKIKQDVIFDYLYVSDLIPVVEYFLTHKNKYPDYNVSTTESIKLSQIVEIINEIASDKSEVEIVNPDLNFEYTGSNERLKNEFPAWKITSYREGLRALYKYYETLLEKNQIDVEAIKKDDYFASSKIKKN